MCVCVCMVNILWVNLLHGGCGFPYLSWYPHFTKWLLILSIYGNIEGTDKNTHGQVY